MRSDIRKKFERAGVTLPPPLDASQLAREKQVNLPSIKIDHHPSESIKIDKPNGLQNTVHPDPIVYTAEEVEDPVLSVHLFGNLRRDLKVLNEEIKRLPDSVEDYHGSLQVIASAATRIKQDTCKLIVAYQDGRGE